MRRSIEYRETAHRESLDLGSASGSPKHHRGRSWKIHEAGLRLLKGRGIKSLQRTASSPSKSMCSSSTTGFLNATPGEHTQYGTDLNMAWLTLSGTVFESGMELRHRHVYVLGRNSQPRICISCNTSLKMASSFKQESSPKLSRSSRPSPPPNNLAHHFRTPPDSSTPGRPEGLLVGKQLDDHRFWLTFSNGWGQSDIDSLKNQRMGVMGRFEFKPFGDWDSLYSFNPYPESVTDGLLAWNRRRLRLGRLRREWTVRSFR